MQEQEQDQQEEQEQQEEQQLYTPPTDTIKTVARARKSGAKPNLLRMRE